MKIKFRMQNTELRAVKSLKSLSLIFSLFFFFQFSIFNSSFAQTYPVQVTPVISGPNLPYLSYYGDQNQHLNLFILLTDFTAPAQSVRLKLSFTGPNLRFETNPFASSLPIYTLNPGEPLLITGSDLLPYLLEQNLLQTEGNAVDLNKLPEGFYTLCVDVIKNDVNAEILSTNNCRSFYIQEIQPPLLNLPLKFSQVDTTQQVISFLWTQPVNYFPNPSVEIRYHFKLYEWIDTTNFNIFATGQGLVFEEETNLNIQLINTAFDVYLRSGYKYIWQVQAKAYDANSGSFLDLITQDGLSAPFWFNYGEKQSLQATLTNGLTLDLSAQAQNTRKGMAFWTITDETPGEGLSDYEAYIIEYRKFDSTGVNPYDWHSDTLQNKNFDIYQLEPAQKYEVQVFGLVGDYRTPLLDTASFVTPPQVSYACDAETMPFSQTNYTPLETAYAGVVFQLGQFELTVSEITALQQVGHYTGKGTIKHDFLGGAKCNVTFEDLLVDQEFVVREGEAQAVTDGAENWTNQHYLDMVTPYPAGGVIESYGFLNDSTVFVVVNGVQQTYTFPENGNLPIVVQGANNVEIQFWPDGTIVVTTYGTSPSSDNLDANADRYAEFEAIAGQEQFFDKKQYDHFASNYELISCENNFNYFVSNTAKGTVGTTQVKAVYHVRTPGYSASGVSFKLGGGYSTVAHTQENDTTFVLTLPERSFSYDVYAFYGEFKIGKLRVVSLQQKERKVRIVPLVAISQSESAIEQAVNSIYAPANVVLDVKIDSVFSTPEFNAQTVFSDPEVDGMQKYTAQMRALRDAYKETHEMASNEYLLFVIPGFETAAIDGYMVRGKGLGFISSGSILQGNLTEFVHTLAHELGHGMGGLSHAWGEDQTKKGLTTNLLDYSSGTTLIKAQWEDLNAAPNVLSLWDSEEDGLIEQAQNLYGIDSSNVTQNVYTYIPKVLIDESDIFQSNNAILFRFTSEQLGRIQNVCLRNGLVFKITLNDNRVLDIVTIKYEYQDVYSNLNGEEKIVWKLPALLYAHNTQARPKTKVKDANGTEYSSFQKNEDDIYIRASQYVSCTEGINFISGIGSDQLSVERTIPICPTPTAGSGCTATDITAILPAHQQKLNELLVDIIVDAQNGDYFPVRQFAVGGIGFVPSEDQIVLFEKCKTLFRYRPNKIVAYILFENSDYSYYTKPLLKQMAENAIAYAHQLYPSKEIALHFTFASKLTGNTPSKSCFREAFAVSQGDMIKAGFSETSLEQCSDLRTSMLLFFAQLKKPQVLYLLYQLYNDEIIQETIDKSDDVSKDVYGNPHVVLGIHLKSKRSSEYQNEQYFDDLQYSPIAGGSGGPDISASWNALQVKIENYYDKEKEHLNDLSYWEYGNVSFENIKESRITVSKILAEYKKENEEATLLVDCIILATGSSGTISISDYYSFSVADRIMDPIVYGLLDVFGMIPIVDYFADGLGVLYSGIRGNSENVLIYSAALATPFAGAAIYKGGKKIVSLFIKKNSSNIYELAIKEAFEEHAGWYKCSNDIPIDEANVQTVKQQINNSSSLSGISQSERKIMHEVASGAGTNKIWSSLDEVFPVYFEGSSFATLHKAVLNDGSIVDVGYSLTRNNVLEFYLNIPQNLQNQGIFKAVYESVKAEYTFTKIKGWWKTSGNYASGESTNLTIFKQKISEGLTPEAAALKTPVGKVYQMDGYNKVEVITNGSEEVIVNFYK